MKSFGYSVSDGIEFSVNYTYFLLELSSIDLRNKAIYDLDDPNRPRFTTSELKEILHERNELKAKVSDLEDELEIYRPKGSSP